MVGDYCCHSLTHELQIRHTSGTWVSLPVSLVETQLSIAGFSVFPVESEHKYVRLFPRSLCL